MSQQSNPTGPARSFPRVARRTVTVDPSAAVTRGFLNERDSLPRVLRPAAGVDLVDWVEQNTGAVEEELTRYGAVLFRGAGDHSSRAFARIAAALTGELLNYIEGSTPRTRLSAGVYTSTEYPPEYAISMHNELSYAHKWPGRLFFCCVQAPAEGGETPIADGRRVLARLRPDLVARFTRLGVRYLRNLHGGSGPGLSWQAVFETEDRGFVEEYCREGGIEFSWRPDGGLRTSQVRPAVVSHPRTGEQVWFNQADQWHPTNLTEELAGAMTAVAGTDQLPIHAEFGDGSPLGSADLAHIRAVMREESKTFRWQEGDILAVDNTMVSHGRRPFSGPRKVLVSMGDTVRLPEVV